MFLFSQATHIKNGVSSTSGRLEELEEFPPPPPPLQSQSSVEGKSESTSSSSTSEYEASHTSKMSMADIASSYNPSAESQKMPDLRKPSSEYHLKKPSEYHLTDCSSIDTKGRSYSQVVEEHLSRSPSLQTSSAGDTSSEEEKKLKAQDSERSPSKLPPVAAQVEAKCDSDSSLSSLPPPPPHIAAKVDKVETIANKMKTRVDGALEKKEKAIDEAEYQRMVREKKEFFQSSRNSGQGKTFFILHSQDILIQIIFSIIRYLLIISPPTQPPPTPIHPQVKVFRLRKQQQ